MKRKIEEELSHWKENPERKPLVMLGCRQVGKTFSIRKFLSKNYKSYVEINLERQPEKRSIFSGDLNAENIIDKLIIDSGTELTPGKSAIFLDEIQASKSAFSSLKWLKEDGRFDIFASGSFLGMELNNDDSPDGSEPISPLGYVNTLTMYPMDFEEYLWAVGAKDKLIDAARQSISKGCPIDPIYNKLLSDHFRRYMIVGGMPEAVKTYAETKDYAKTVTVIKDILDILRADTGKYSKKNTDRMKILACMASIPAQLASDRRKFQFVDIEKSSGGRNRYGEALEWLINAGMVYRCYNLSSVNPPLSLNIKETMFKAYMCDTGLLIWLMDDADPGAIVNSDPFANNGAIMENAVAAALVKNGYPLYYYAKEDSTLEIDFVMNRKSIELIEVKSGKNKRSKSLRVMLSEKDRDRKGINICEGNIMTDENSVLHLPLYGASFLPKSEVDYIPPVDELP